MYANDKKKTTLQSPEKYNWNFIHFIHFSVGFHPAAFFFFQTFSEDLGSLRKSKVGVDNTVCIYMHHILLHECSAVLCPVHLNGLIVPPAVTQDIYVIHSVCFIYTGYW